MFKGNVVYFVDGKEYYIKTNDKKKYGYRVGKKIMVKYNANSPAEAITMHSFIDYLAPLTFIIFGIYVILATLKILPSIF